MNVLRYSIEETVVKVDHMAQAAQSTASDHDLGEALTHPWLGCIGLYEMEIQET